MSERRRHWDRAILLVADPSDGGAFDGTYDRRIDRPGPETVDDLRSALANCCDRLVQISDLGELTDRIGRHQRSLVFPYWFGQGSRSRHGLVPAICEANDVMFVGADAFAKIVCNDKELSKAVCQQADLRTPRSGVVRTADELRLLRGLRLPVMIKPNYEGTSLGISDRNRCQTWDDAAAMVRELLAELGQPVVIEEFVRGREFSACLMGSASGVEIRVGGSKVEGRPDYLDDRVFTADLKRGGRLEMEFENLAGALDEPTLARMQDCFLRLGKVELLRIDGRLGPDGCTVIELTPDIYLGSDGEFAVAHGRDCGGYEGFVSRVVANCIDRYEAQPPV